MPESIFFSRLCYGVVLVLRKDNQMEQFFFFSGLRQIKKLDSVSHSRYTLRELFFNYAGEKAFFRNTVLAVRRHAFFVQQLLFHPDTAAEAA